MTRYTCVLAQVLLYHVCEHESLLLLIHSRKIVRHIGHFCIAFYLHFRVNSVYVFRTNSGISPRFTQNYREFSSTFLRTPPLGFAPREHEEKRPKALYQI